MSEFKINKFLSLKLEYGETNIYINERKIDQCKYLLIDKVTLDEIPSFFESFESVDEATVNADHSLENTPDLIPPETEFWAHCSNLQVWAENNYDTRLLHMSIAFSLLKELAEAGDVVAKRVFKEEIAKRLGSGYPTVVDFLMLEHFEIHLSHEELITSVLVPEEAEVIIELEELTGNQFFQFSNLNENYSEEGPFEQKFVVKNKHVTGLWIHWGKEVPKDLPPLDTKLKMLKHLYYTGDKIKHLPEAMINSVNLEVLWLESNLLEKIPESISNLRLLKSLSIQSTVLRSIPETIGKLLDLENLFLRNNLSTLPNSIGKLVNLEDLNLSYNKLSKIPECIFNLTNLKTLNINHNNLTSIPKSIDKLEKLNTLIFSLNPITKLLKSLIQMKKLKFIFTDKIKGEYNKAIMKTVRKNGVTVFGD
ncbi:hypothetical protein LCGC14_2141210 [marine sediment metagenome]|uniref:Disease resistance R13L4/SHOC-2-like LRR domain-containing protein n=1 Tax=marine sediment metagenome TaxID=412755 RepID=A0A0F9EKN3_9ZZZZ